jgi:AcrR family transcriptional regulator
MTDAVNELSAKDPEGRRRRILAATVTVLRARGFSRTRVVDIADEAGTSPGLVLYHYKSLEGALAAALTAVEEAFYNELEHDLAASSGPIDRIRHMGELASGSGPAVGDWALWLELWVRALHHEAARTTRESLDRRWRAVLRSAIDAGIASDDFRPRSAADSTVRLASLMDGLAIQLALDDPDMTSERMCDLWLAAASLELGTDIGRVVAGE